MIKYKEKIKLKKVKKKIIQILFFTPLNRLIKTYINIIYPILFKLKKNEFLYKKHENNNVIVSLTSIPSRIDKVHYVIKSLLLQSYRPNKVILWLSDEDFPDKNGLPETLLKLLSTDFEIRWCENLKPHKKYFYTMKENPDSIIITVDDDGFYRKNLIRDLVKSYEKYPNAISCTRAHRMIFNENNQLLPYNKWEYEVKNVYTPNKFIFATGVGGVLYPPNSLNKKVFNKELIYKLCLNADDVWLKIMSLLNNTPVVSIPSSKCKYVVGINNAEKVRLSKSNVLNSDNDKYLKDMFNYFNITYLNFLED